METATQTLWWLIFGSGWLIFLVWGVTLGPGVVMLWFRRLDKKTRPVADPAEWPLVSVIVAARNEGANIEAALRSLLQSDYPHLEIVAVNDRSHDDTPAIMDRIAARDDRLRVIHIDSLPPAWLGKNHAMHCGAGVAGGEFLLFTDGDVLYETGTIRQATQYALHRRLDHLCLFPKMIPGRYWENALTSHFGLLFVAGTFLWLVPTPFRWTYVGVGAFNLVRASAYRQAGGHVPIRFDVLDDVKLGKLMKRSGFRQDVLFAGDALRVKWQTSAGQVIRGLEKNAFAATDYSITKFSILLGTFALCTFAPYFAVLAWHDVRASGFAAALVLTHVCYGALSRMVGLGWSVLPVLPLAALGTLYAFCRSAAITLFQGGVRWRETLYRLPDLRKGLYR